MYFSIIGFAAFIFGRAAAEETSSSPRQASPIPLESSLVENAKIFADIVCQDAENETKNQNTKRKFKLRLLKVCCFPNLKSGQANGQCVEFYPSFTWCTLLASLGCCEKIEYNDKLRDFALSRGRTPTGKPRSCYPAARELEAGPTQQQHHHENEPANQQHQQQPAGKVPRRRKGAATDLKQRIQVVPSRGETGGGEGGGVVVPRLMWPETGDGVRLRSLSTAPDRRG